MSAQQLADRALINLGRGLKENGYRFITPTPLTHERVFGRQASPLANDLRDVFGWSMSFDADLLPAALREELLQADVVEKHDSLWRSAVRWSSLEDLLFAHSAYPTTQSDAVFFGPDSYRFAQVIEAHLQQRFEPVRRAVDIGCGAGVGALVIARARHDAQVLAVDINPRALRMTAVNAELAGLGNVTAYHSDVLASVEGDFDLIVANPPYMNDDRQRAYRHGGGALGEQLSVRIVSESLGRLALGAAWCCTPAWRLSREKIPSSRRSSHWWAAMRSAGPTVSLTPTCLVKSWQNPATNAWKGLPSSRSPSRACADGHAHVWH